MNLRRFLKPGETFGESYIVILPIKALINKTKQESLNMGKYRNNHWAVNHNQKEHFHSIVGPLIKDKPKADKIWVWYDLFIPQARFPDLRNVTSVVDKYFLDTLQEYGIIPNDSVREVPLILDTFNAIDRNNGHVKAHVTNIVKGDPNEDSTGQ